MIARRLSAFCLALCVWLGGSASFEPSYLSVAIAAQHARIPMFSDEGVAQSHCAADVVVWLNTRTGIWHEKGMRWYGRTKQGAYVCRKEAAAAGYRDTRNGQ